MNKENKNGLRNTEEQTGGCHREWEGAMSKTGKEIKRYTPPIIKLITHRDESIA